MVPKGVNDEQLFEAAEYRSRGRLPVLSYVHSGGSSITRCAQPKVFFFCFVLFCFVLFCFVLCYVVLFLLYLLSFAFYPLFLPSLQTVRNVRK